MSARTPCLVVAYAETGTPLAYWREGPAGTPGEWITDAAEATAMDADEAHHIAHMWQIHANTRGSLRSYRHSAARDHRQQEPTT